MESNQEKELTKYEKLFQSILSEINAIESKVVGILSFDSDKLKSVGVEDSPSASPLERDLSRVLGRLIELKNSIN